LSFPLDEVVVGVTDYLLALECAVFAWVLRAIREGRWQIRNFFAAFFGLTALASVAGGTSHMFFSGSSSLAASLFWMVTVLALGGVAFAAWSIGAILFFAERNRVRVVILAAVEWAVYGAYVVAIDDRFVVAIANYIPAALFLAISFAFAYWRDRRRTILSGLSGLALTGIAAVMQRSGLALHPLYFNHNATYHLVQGIGFFLIFIAAVFFAHDPARPSGART